MIAPMPRIGAGFEQIGGFERIGGFQQIGDFAKQVRKRGTQLFRTRSTPRPNSPRLCDEGGHPGTFPGRAFLALPEREFRARQPAHPVERGRGGDVPGSTGLCHYREGVPAFDRLLI